MAEHQLPEYRTGIGFDAHPLVEGRKLILGGVDVPYHLGLSGHSDGDVLVHALMDALLGAACLGDKGGTYRVLSLTRAYVIQLCMKPWGAFHSSLTSEFKDRDRSGPYVPPFVVIPTAPSGVPPWECGSFETGVERVSDV